MSSMDRRSFLAALPAAALAQDDDSPRRVRDLASHYEDALRRFAAQSQLRRLAIAVTDDDGESWVAAFGDTRVDTPQPLSTASQFFTATAALFAVSSGLCRLNDRVASHLDSFTALRRDREHDPHDITIHDLLTHSSGLPNEAPVGSSLKPAPSTWHEHLESIRDVYLKFEPGERRAFSNLGYDALGELLEKTTRTPFPAWMHGSLQRMGMRSAFYDAERVPMTAAAGLSATPDDLARFLTWQLRDCPGLDSNLRHKQRTPFGVPEEVKSGYGYGLHIREWYDALLFTTSSSYFGACAWIGFVPRSGAGLAMLSDRPAPQFSLRRLGEELLRETVDHLHNTKLWPHRSYPETPQGIAMPEEYFTRLEGTYLLQDDLVSIQWDHWKQRIFFSEIEQPLAAKTFTDFAAPGYALKFVLDAEERPAALHLTHPAGFDILPVAALKNEPEGPALGEWRKHAGVFELDTPDGLMTLRFEMRNGWLYLVEPAVLRLRQFRENMFYTGAGDMITFGERGVFYHYTFFDRAN